MPPWPSLGLLSKAYFARSSRIDSLRLSFAFLLRKVVALVRVLVGSDSISQSRRLDLVLSSNSPPFTP